MKFNVEITLDAEVDIAQEVLDSVDDDWREFLYSDILTEYDVVKHITYNMIVNGLPLSHIDGFAQFSDAEATCKVYDEDVIVY